jgi:hypothetical protein
MDVTSLYTNIPHDDGMAACRKIWEQRTDQEPLTECLVEMLTEKSETLAKLFPEPPVVSVPAT